MISSYTQQKLASLIMEIAKQEIHIEAARQTLCEQPLFEPYAAFQRLDRSHKGTLTDKNIYNYLLENNINTNLKECSNIVTWYHTDYDKTLSYSDFLELVLPKSNSLLHEIACQRPNYLVKSTEFLKFDIEYALSHVLEKECKIHTFTNKMKEELYLRFDFSLANLFKCVDILGIININIDSLTSFLERKGFKPASSYAKAFIKRVDKDKDGVLSWAEFSNAMSIIEPAIGSKMERPKTPGLSVKSPEKSAMCMRSASKSFLKAHYLNDTVCSTLKKVFTYSLR